jgi:Cof subfamily protein (haloacid dehalogenase superfamily)
MEIKMIKPHLIALDLDGTLLMSDGRIGPKTKEILKHLSDRGHHIAIATGRILALASSVPADLDLACHVVACNGAVVKDASSNTISEHTFRDDQITRLREVLDSEFIYYHFYSEDTIYATELKHTAKKFFDITRAKAGKSPLKVQVLSEVELDFSEANVFKFGIFQDGTYDFERVRRRLSQLEEFDTMFSAPSLLDIMLKGVSKWTGIEGLASSLAIDHENIIVFGDNENDSEMLIKAGVGVAMGNAEDSIKALAKYATESNDEEGIYTFLSQFSGLFD